MKKVIETYSKLLSEIKVRVRSAQVKAALSVNAEMIQLYYDIGEMIYQRQQQREWGAKIIKKLAIDIKNELPEEKGFSERNLKFMVQFFNEYNQHALIGKQPVSQLKTIPKQSVSEIKTEEKRGDIERVAIRKQLVSQIPWGHNILLMQKIKDLEIRLQYMQQIILEGWTRDVLATMIKNGWHLRQGKVISNFKNTLPNPQSDYAQELLKNPYSFGFLTLTEPYNERELETELIKHLEKFLIELGAGFG